MHNNLKVEIQTLIDQHNEAELAHRRDYYQYLVEKGRTEGETLEAHIDRFAQLIRTGPAATEAELSQLTERAGAPLPRALADFYREIGGLRGQGLAVFTPAELLRRFADSAAPYERLTSLGLTRMIRLAWGNDRFEFDPENGMLSQAQVDGLDARYRCIGWLENLGDAESHTFLYFDNEDRFATLHFHQDYFDELFEENLQPMLSASPARRELKDVLLKWLAPPRPTDADEE